MGYIHGNAQRRPGLLDQSVESLEEALPPSTIFYTKIRTNIRQIGVMIGLPQCHVHWIVPKFKRGHISFKDGNVKCIIRSRE